MPTASAKITGDKDLLKTLRDLGKKSITINRQACNKAASPIVRAAKDECPVDHGHLKKALTKKVYNRGPIANAIIGADANYVAAAATGDKLDLGNKAERKSIIDAAREDGGVIRPAKYDHLVEFGHTTPEGVQIPAQPFLRNAWEDSIDAAKQIYEKELAAGIEKAATK